MFLPLVLKYFLHNTNMVKDKDYCPTHLEHPSKGEHITTLHQHQRAGPCASLEGFNQLFSLRTLRMCNPLQAGHKFLNLELIKQLGICCLSLCMARLSEAFTMSWLPAQHGTTCLLLGEGLA